MAAERPLPEYEADHHCYYHKHQQVNCHSLRNPVQGKSVYSYNENECVEDSYYPAALEKPGTFLLSPIRDAK